MHRGGLALPNEETGERDICNSPWHIVPGQDNMHTLAAQLHRALPGNAMNTKTCFRWHGFGGEYPR